MELIVFLAIYLAVALIPTAVAISRRCVDVLPISLVSLFVPFVGWIIGMVWAFIGRTRASPRDYRLAKQRFHMKRATEKTCPDCAEVVKSAARVCRHCGYEWPDRH